MDVRSPLFQNIALIVAGVLFLNPIVATAAQLAVDQAAGGNTALTQAGNGVPVVNIATPNGSGLSHNKFTDYNVGQQGLILNNATDKLQSTQLGGIIIGNANLKNGAAGLILNEVTGGNASQLKGYTEVAGRSAAVIVANPHGITCDGCGFINTPRVTLSTGTPVIENGRLQRFDVNGGQIAIEGQGLNAGNLDQFDLITRSAQINAELHANKLNIVTGRNEVDATTLAATAKADDGSNKPMLAIDSSALGGMYAGAIRLVGTEQGVGVKLAGDMAASAGDIQIDANGKLSLAQTSASGNLALKAGEVELAGKTYAGGKADVGAQNQIEVQQSLAAAGNVNLRGAQVVNQGVIEAGVRPDNSRTAADLKLSAEHVRNAGTLIGNGQLQVNASQVLDNQGGTLSGTTLTKIEVGHLNNHQGRILADQQLQISGESFNNSGGLLQSQGDAGLLVKGALENRQGDIHAKRNLELRAGNLDNRDDGLIVGQALLDAHVDQIDNRGGALIGKQALSLNAQRIDNSAQGLINSSGSVALTTNKLDSSNQGEVSAKGTLAVQANELVQRGGRLIGESDVSLDLQGGSLDNQAGVIVARNKLMLTDAATLDNRGGTLSAKEGVQLSAGRIDNLDGGLINSAGALDLRADHLDSSNAGEVSASGALDVQVAELVQRQGRLLGETQAYVQVSGLLDNRGGVLSGKQGLTLSAETIDNRDLGLINTLGGLDLSAGTLDSSQLGEVSASGDIQLRLSRLIQEQGRLIGAARVNLEVAGQVDNRGGIIHAKQGLNLLAGQIDNTGKGLINSSAALALQADELDSSSHGEVSAQGDISLSAKQWANQGGALLGDANVSIDMGNGRLSNQGGLINAGKKLTLQQVAALDNRGGELSAAKDIEIGSALLDNSQGGRIIASEHLALSAGELVNSAGGLLSGWQGLSVEGDRLDNSGRGTLSSREGALKVELTGALNNSDHGALVSRGDQRITVASLDNREGGILSSEAGLELNAAEQLDNRNQGLVAASELDIRARQVLNGQSGRIDATDTLVLAAQTLDNQGGRISSANAMRVLLTGTLRNGGAGQLVSGGALLLKAGSIDNRGGQLISRSLLDVFAASLDNSSSGTLAADGDLTLEVSGALHNANDGLIYSRQGSLALVANELLNDGGSLQAHENLRAEIDQTLSNRGGQIASRTGNLELQAQSLDNGFAGVLDSALGWLRLNLAGLFNNSSGTAQAKRDITLASAQVDNSAGHLSSLEGDSRIITDTFTNQGGGLYAHGLLSVQAGSFDNQGGSSAEGGKVSARIIDFSLGGALNNRHGLIEAGDRLLLRSTSLTNAQGTLRSLGQSDTSHLSTTVGAFDNRGGLLEVANHNLSFEFGELLNTGGTISHVGSGDWGLSTGEIMRAGGTLMTNGVLDIRAGQWTLDGTLQARELTLSVDDLTLGSGARLLATQRLIGEGLRWVNQGLIASDGGLELTLSDSYAGGGGLRSLGGLDLQAASLDLASTGKITSGADALLTVGGVIRNAGQIASAGDFTLRAATLNNHGTLGSAQTLSLYAPVLRNEHGLIFSGQDMLLRTGQFTNQRGSVYSLGRLDIAANDADGWLDRLENISGSMESAGAMRIQARELSNRRESFSTELRMVSGSFDVYSDDRCKGKGCELYFRSVENYEDVVVGSKNSPAAFITSGGDFRFNGSTFENQYSTVSAVGDIAISTDILRNTGAGGGEQRHLNSGYYTRDRSAYSTFIDNKNLFNLYNNPASSSYQPGAISVAGILASVGNQGFYDTTSYSVPISGAVAASAIIQAGGAVNINASQRIDNSVVRANYASGGPTGGHDTNVTLSGHISAPAITAQLPPDLAQKQVNPVQLPGFSLPVGENGLFRLSAQAGQSTQPGAEIQTSQAGSGSQVMDAVVNGNAVGAPSNQHVQTIAGLPDNNRSPAAHKYLIETNPALTNLKNFLNSDYLLGNLGYDPDQAQKRLGDGLYEQHLIREAVVARTGQRYLAGLTSDEAMFRYLMDNAIASKQALGLSLGVTLTAEQVAALTHDIVWLEEHEVLGEKVLVPVLYLAQAQGRLAANGALIQGRDVNLISGGDLLNQGTLRASANLSATASNIFNGGLMEAGERLQLLATDSIRNAQGGIINGRELSLTALTGDVINERSVTTVHAAGGNDRLRNDIVNNAARIEARGDLTISAGRDIQSLGSVIQADGNALLSAGRDLSLVSQAEVDTYEYRRRREQGYDNSITQHGSSLEVGGGLTLSAQRDLAVVASQIKADDDIDMAAGSDLIIASAADEQHQYAYRKQGKTKTTQQADSVVQRSSGISAGGDLMMQAGNDLVLSASRLEAEGDAYLYAGGELALLAAQNSEYSLYDMKKKGSWGSKKTQRDEVTTVRNVGSSITTGGDLILVSEGDQLYQKARLESGNDLILDSGRSITFEAVKDLDQESHEKSSNSWAWTSAKGKGSTDETLYQSQLIAKGDLVIQAVDGLKIDVKEVNQQSVSQTIDAMVKADPELAWLKEMEQRGDVDWRQVKEIHDSFKYSHSGLGAGAAMIIAIVVAYFTAGAMSGLVANGATAAGASTAATSAGGAWAAGTGASLSGIGWANAAVTAGLTGMTSNAAISTINNRGNLGAVLKDITTEDALRGYAVAGITAGLTNGLYDGWVGTETGTAGAIQNGGNVIANGGLSTLEGIGRFAGNQLLQNGTSTVLDRALGGDSSFSDALRSSLANTFAAAGFNLVGDLTAPERWDFKDGSPVKIAMHAVMGGLAAEAAGGDFKTGALAAGVNELLVDSLAKQYGEMDPDQKKSLLVMNSQVIGVLAAAAQGGDEKALQTGSWVAGTATTYNYLNHAEANERREKQKECRGGNRKACDRVDELNALDKQRDQVLERVCRADAASASCGKLLADALIARESFAPYRNTPEWNAQINDDPALQQYSFEREVQSITNALAQAPQTTPELKRLVEAIVGLGADFTPGVGDVKALIEAETPFDYLMASVGVVPVVGDAVVHGIKQAKGLFKEGKVAESAKVLEDLSGGPKVTSGGYPELARPSQTTPGNVILGDLDSLGRPTGVTAVIKPETLGGGSSANPAIRPPGFEGQGANHARGHLIANSLGGTGDDARNLVTLFQRNTNHPNMSSFERQVKAAIQGGETVSYRAIPIYTGSNLMPTGVTLTARGSGGFNLDVSIPNINGVK
ncbi:two-partner secretion domain-containing protein [Ectopseudomonas guguanensis]|uniref:two-partner secretion domain-containing protein n=1 Tax=Ectopseudomonas guguanensis TaxID=1198456 RepID=UPI002856E712|nr:DUF637 domain-containing protein [Pseudomonas guguanensis]MDR8013308.1 DUF637 domain-containing protein [Pseudomonas guguanensis]